MKWKTLKGHLREVAVQNMRVDWDGDSLSIFQSDCKDLLYPYWRHDVVCEEFRIPGGRKSLDFLNITKRIAVEVQGRQHSQYVPFMAGSRMGYADQLKRDLDKARWCEINNITLVEVHPEDLPALKADIKGWFLSTYGITL